MTPAIHRTEYAALVIRAVRVAKSGNQKDIGIGRIDENFSDLLTVSKSDRLPAFAAIVGSEHSDALSNVAPHVRFAASDINPVGIGSCNGNGSN